MNTTTVVLQARTGSSRLPGKVLADLAGQPMLAFQIRRILPQARASGWTIVVATSLTPRDDSVAELAAREGVPVVRGSEGDVLSRFIAALDAHPATDLVRLTGDCPFTDPAIVADAITLHRTFGADYTSNVLPRSFPKGLDVEVATASALRIANAEATDPADREHVMPFLYRHPERFRLANLDSGLDLGDQGWTVDTADDLARVRALAAHMADPISASWHTIRTMAELPSGAGVRFSPLPSAAPGTSPWSRSWSVAMDGHPVGTARVEVEGARGRRSIHVADERQRDIVAAALERFLQGDQQMRQ